MTGRRSRVGALALVLDAALVAAVALGCAPASPAGTSPAAAGGTADASGPSGSRPARESAAVGGSAAPSLPPSAVPPSAFPSSLPGLTGWTVISPQSVAIAVVDDGIQLTLTRRALWFQGQRGVLVGQPVSGDFRISATVRATDRVGSPLVDRTDGLVELGGLMARADNAARENYVFIVVGTDADGLAVETKSTRDSESRFDGPGWPASAADLRLCRVGATFTAFKRPAGSSGPWSTAATFDRPDLPATLQVGPNIYASASPDLRVTFSGLRIEPVASPSACAEA